MTDMNLEDFKYALMLDGRAFRNILSENKITVKRIIELAEADRDGRCVVLDVKPGGIVRFARNPRAKQEKVDAITIYSDGRITYSFHEVGMRTQYVDEWSEVESEDYAQVEPSEASEAAMKGEQHGN